MENLKVWDKSEKRMKKIVMLEWNLDNTKELIELHTYPIAIYRAGYRLKQDERGQYSRRIDELEILHFSGFYDEHNNEIWEGDILMAWNTRKVTVKKVASGFWLVSTWHEDIELHHDNVKWYTFIKLGSVYENPELLVDKS